MDSAVLAALVGGIATVVAAMVGLWVKHRNDEPQKVLERMPETQPVASVTERSSENHDEYNFRHYKLTFFPECTNDLIGLGLDKSTLITLVEAEFLAHMSYFVYDLEEYAMPVKAKFIVHIDKVENNVVFKRVFPCTANEAKLASWNDILTLYRRATRLAYRENPETLTLNKSMLPRAREMHVELVYRIIKHFQTYEELELNVEPKNILYAARAIDEGPGLRLKSLISESHPSQVPLAPQSSKTTEIDFHLRQALSAWMEVDEIERDLEDGIIKETAALGALVTSVERSLQFLHKLLLMYPPVK